MSIGPIALAEAEVAHHKASVRAELQLLSAKARRTAGSPRFVAGALVGAIVLGYLVAGRSRNGKRAPTSAPGAWSLVLQTAHLLVPLIRTMRPPRRVPAPARTQLLQSSREPEPRVETDRE
jgi:hypothetical protein